MALQLNTQFRGLNLEGAYYRVWSFNGNKNTLSFEVELCVNDSNERLDSTTFNIDYDINGENPIKQAYLYLKTLPEFEGALDV